MLARPSPGYPFQMIVADYFSLHGNNFLVVADRFSGWKQVYPALPGKFDGKHQIKFLRDFFASWNIAEHITTDGGLQMMCGEVQTWLRKWDVKHHPSSAYFPHSNSRAEIAVKSRKSPAQMVFGRALRDHIPALPYKYAASADWCVSQELRERLLAKSREEDGEKLVKYTKQLADLTVGTQVVIPTPALLYDVVQEAVGTSPRRRITCWGSARGTRSWSRSRSGHTVICH
jgi:hypothetical protein